LTARGVGDARQLAETPVRQTGGATRRLANGEVVIDRFGPEFTGVEGALCDPLAACASGGVERVDAGEPFIGWARGPFPVRGGRRDSGHTSPGHVVLLSTGPEGEWWNAPTSGDVEGVARTATTNDVRRLKATVRYVKRVSTLSQIC